MVYDKFPIIKVLTEMMNQKELDAIDSTLDDFNDNPELSRLDAKLKEEKADKIKEQMDREDKLAS